MTTAMVEISLTGILRPASLPGLREQAACEREAPGLLEIPGETRDLTDKNITDDRQES